MFRLSTIAGAALAAVLAFAAPAAAPAMTVQPVILDLQTGGRGMSAVITVENPSQAAVPVEISMVDAAYSPDGVKSTETATNDLLVFPPQAIIPPGETQAFRVQFVGDPAMPKSKHYMVTVAQLPVKLPEGQSAIQILYNFQVVVNVGLAGQKPKVTLASSTIEEVEGKPRAVLVFKNASDTYGYVSDGLLRIIERDAAGKELMNKAYNQTDIAQDIGFGLVAARETRRLVVPLDLVPGGATIDAKFTPPR